MTYNANELNQLLLRHCQANINKIEGFILYVYFLKQLSKFTIHPLPNHMNQSHKLVATMVKSNDHSALSPKLASPALFYFCGMNLCPLVS